MIRVEKDVRIVLQDINSYNEAYTNVHSAKFGKSGLDLEHQS